MAYHLYGVEVDAESGGEGKGAGTSTHAVEGTNAAGVTGVLGEKMVN